MAVSATNRFGTQSQDFKPAVSCFITTKICIPVSILKHG